MKQIGIIGAGAAGLCALRHALSTKGVNPIVWEHSSTVGGTWVYIPSTGLDQYQFPIHSSMYGNLRTNLPKEIMGFPDFPFEKGGNSFIHHTEVLQYLNKYADHFCLKPWIKFEHHVSSVERIETKNGASVWEVKVQDLKNKSVSTVVCDGILVCNGHYSVPNIPEMKGLKTFLGKKVHSHDYRQPDSYKNHNVAVLGAAASGMDISLEIATVANQVYLSHNFPCPIPSKLPRNVIQVRGISEAFENGFMLNDGSRIIVDDIIFCTGYQFQFPFLKPSCEVKIIDNCVKSLYKHIIHSKYPSMGFIGIVFQVLPFPLFDMQVKYFLASFIGKFLLPRTKEMRMEIDEDLKKLFRLKHTCRHYHQLGSNQWKYMRLLCSKIEGNRHSNYIAYLEKFWNIIWIRRIFSLVTYKQFDYNTTCSKSNREMYQIDEYYKGKKIHTSISLAFLMLIQGSIFFLLNLRVVFLLIIKGIVRLFASVVNRHSRLS